MTEPAEPRANWTEHEVFHASDENAVAAEAIYAARLATALQTSVFTPEQFGAVGNGTTNDTAAVQAMFDALPSTGGRVQLSKTYLVRGVTCDTPVVIEGNGGAKPKSASLVLTSGFVCDTDGVAALTLTGYGAGQRVLRDFGIRWTASWDPHGHPETPPACTSGCAIRFDGATADHSGAADFAVMDNVHVLGFWNGIEVLAGQSWTMSSCFIQDWVNYGLLIQNSEGTDVGDMGLLNCTFEKRLNYTMSPAAIRWESGGGLRVANCKLLGGGTAWFTYGVDIRCVAGGYTGDFMFSNNSIENAASAGIRVGGEAGSTLKRIVVTGNQFQTWHNGYAVYADGTSMGGALTGITIVGNSMDGNGLGVYLASVGYVVLQGNNGATLGDGFLLLGNYVQYFTQSGNTWPRGIIAVYDFDAGAASGAGRGYTRPPWVFDTEVKQVTTSLQTTRFRPGPNSAVLVTVEARLNDATSGSAWISETRPITRDSTSTVTVGPPIESMSFGPAAAQVALNWDVATYSGFALVTLTSVNGHSITGGSKVTILGACDQLVP